MSEQPKRKFRHPFYRCFLQRWCHGRPWFISNFPRLQQILLETWKPASLKETTQAYSEAAELSQHPTDCWLSIQCVCLVWFQFVQHNRSQVPWQCLLRNCTNTMQ